MHSTNARERGAASRISGYESPSRAVAPLEKTPVSQIVPRGEVRRVGIVTGRGKPRRHVWEVVRVARVE